MLEEIDIPGIGKIKVKDIKLFFQEMNARLDDYHVIKSRTMAFNAHHIAPLANRASFLADAGRYEQMAELIKGQYEAQAFITERLEKFISTQMESNHKAAVNIR